MQRWQRPDWHERSRAPRAACGSLTCWARIRHQQQRQLRLCITFPFIACAACMPLNQQTRWTMHSVCVPL